MIRWLLVLAAFMLFPSYGSAQVAPEYKTQLDTTQYIRIPLHDFQETISSINFMLRQDSIQTKTIDLLYEEVVLLRARIANDSAKINLLEMNAQFMRNESDLWQSNFMDLVNPPLYKTKEAYFTYGVIITLLGLKG